MSITMDTALSSLLTNKRRVSALKSLGVTSVGEALTYYPFRVTDPVPLRCLREARIGAPMAFAAEVRDLRVVPMNARRGYRLEAVVEDGEFARSRGMAGAVSRLVFFSYRKSYVDWVSMRLRAGSRLVVSGVPTEFNGQLQFTHPEIVTVAPAEPSDVAGAGLKYDAETQQEALARVSRPRPVYHASSRISSEHIHETILQLMWMLGGRDVAADASGASAAAPGVDDIAVQPGEEFTAELAEAIPDVLPEAAREARGLMHRAEAFRAIHDPDTVADFKRGIDTLRYEEAFVSQVSLLRSRRDARQDNAYPCPVAAVHKASDPAADSVAEVAGSVVDDSSTAAVGSSSDSAGSPAHVDSADPTLRDRFIESLPFDLTSGQREVIDAIAEDMACDHPMQRLLQGEVGSGKTVVALAAMLQAVGAGHQAVLVAPTQVLAEQHHETISRMISSIPAADGGAENPDIPVILLTGGMKLAARRKALGTAASGAPCIIVATHAAFSKTFQATNLALVVIDEQHRFGVEQRESLRARSEMAPHLLVMTATPIPRTAAMTWFGDLDISWLTELPGGRKPIRTVVVNEADGATMGRMFAHIRARLDAGERAYVVCARIDDEAEDAGESGGAGRGGAKAPAGATRDEAMGGIELDPYAASEGDGSETLTQRPPLHTVAEIAVRLAKLPQFDGIPFATLTGRDKDETKQRVMADFADGKTPMLVATTVIEVGVDVPQASCIVIFDADRYGLSQLHQLRGRVGRGGTNSWAFLVSCAEAGSPAEARLEVIHGTLDGAEIAQADLEFRGAGDVLGDAQSGGKSSLKLLRVVKDADLIADARSRAEALLADDPDLSGEVQLAGAVLDFIRGNESFLTSS